MYWNVTRKIQVIQPSSYHCMHMVEVQLITERGTISHSQLTIEQTQKLLRGSYLMVESA